MANDGNVEKNSLVAGGFEFLSEADAEKAEMDLSKINVLEKRVKASRPAEIKAVYEKSIENKIFKTPVGWGYLLGLRKKLLDIGISEEDLMPIPLNVSITRHSALENLNVKQRIKLEEPKGKLEFKRVFPIVLNVVLAILVVLMFIIASTSESDNIINYKRNITNRFSAWEQELTEREKKVRLAERELGIEFTSDYYNESGDDFTGGSTDG